MMRLTPVERFFGVGASRGPFELLGVDPQRVDEGRVLDALRNRLARLDRHPMAHSLEADEARLALHTAAAQLLDPGVRAHIIEHLDQGADASSRPLSPPDLSRPGPSITSPPQSRAPDPRVQEFREAAFLLVRGGGGWNHRSMHRVAALAHAYGLSPEQVRSAFHMRDAGAVRSHAPSIRRSEDGAGAAPVGSAQAPASAPRSVARKRRSKTVPAIIGAAIGVSIIALIAATALLDATSGPSGDSGRDGAEDAPDARTNASPAPARNRTGQSGPLSIVDDSNVMDMLSRSVEMAANNPGEAAWRFESAVEWIADHWPDLAAQRRDEALAGAAAFLHATPPGGAARQRAVGAIGAGGARLASQSAPAPDELAGIVWSMGVIHALSRDRELGAGLRQELRGRLTSAVGDDPPAEGSFHTGALAALRAIVVELTGNAGARVAQSQRAELWRRWGNLFAALGPTSRDGEERARLLLLDSVERLLREGPSPAGDRASRQALSLLMKPLPWGAALRDKGARAAGARLLAWFDDESIPTRDVAVVTEWLGDEARVPGVTFAMVMPRSASRETRAAYRDRYAEAWGLDATRDSDSLEAAWADAAAGEHERAGRDRGVIGAIAHAVVLARLNEAAAARWRRDADRAGRLVEDPARGVDEALSPSQSRGAPLDPESRDTDWVVALLSGPNNAGARLEALDTLSRRGGTLNRVEGDVLARFALRGSPTEVRRFAGELARKHADDPAMVNGALEALPTAPSTPEAAALIETIADARLPAPDDPEYELSARRALVGRLLELLAVEGRTGASDRLAELLGESHAARAGVDAPRRTPPDASTPAGASLDAPETRRRPPTPLEAAEALRAHWEAEARRYTPNPYAPRSMEQIARRLHARRRLAHGVVQRFVAEQTAIADLMAGVVAAERPEAAGEAQRVLEGYDAARREATHIGRQIEAGEDAMLQLWALRFGERPLERPDEAQEEGS